MRRSRDSCRSEAGKKTRAGLGDQPKSVEPQYADESPSRSPGGHAKTAVPVWKMYSLSASPDICASTGMKFVVGLRTKAMKNSPASRCPKPSEPSVKL